MASRTKQTAFIPDIHGRFDKLQALMEVLKTQTTWSLERGDELVQGGDKNDRGPDTYSVFEYFRMLKKDHPDRVTLLMGNHELMLLAAGSQGTRDYRFGDPGLIWMNGGQATLKSYSVHVQMKHYGKMGLPYALGVSGHLDFLRNDHVLGYENELAWFSHAPIPRREFLPARVLKGPDLAWQQDVDTLTWTYIDENTEYWVDPEPVPSKFACYGHIHGLKYNPQDRLIVLSKVRRHGKAFLVDTGCGCHPDAALSCLLLPSLQVYNSDGETYSLATSPA